MPGRPKWWKRDRDLPVRSPVARVVRPLVRPWALAGPVIVLLICLPLLRPLWSPGVMSAREAVSLETARSLLEHHGFALDPARAFPAEAVVGINGRLVSREPPLFAVFIASAAWVAARFGVTFQNNPQLLDYFLTLAISSLPTALSCGLVYRLGRAFDLNRPWRVALALACVLASGWVSFAVVLLPSALAMSLVMAAITAFVQVSRAERFTESSGWLLVAGLCAVTAAALEPLALWVLPVLLFGVPTMGRRWRDAVGGMLLVALGAAIPISAYVITNRAATGDLTPPRWHTVSYASAGPTVVPSVGDDIDPVDVSIWVVIGRSINRLLIFTVGSHGVLSHFPFLLIALAGAASVLRRHWAMSLKWLAAAMLASLAMVLAYKMWVRMDDVDLDFAAPRLTIIVPALMIWSGSWMRRPHARLAWTMAAIALGVSVTISLLGMTAPAPPGGYVHYTAAEAASRLFASPPSVVAEHR